MGAPTIVEHANMVFETRVISSGGRPGTLVSGLVSQAGFFGEESTRVGEFATEVVVSKPPNAKSKPSSVPKSAKADADCTGDFSAWVSVAEGSSPKAPKVASFAVTGKLEKFASAPAKNPPASAFPPPSGEGNVEAKSPQPSRAASAAAGGAARDEADEASVGGAAAAAGAALVDGSRRGLGGGWAASSLESMDRRLGFRPCFA
jgi:hypothetical protein